MDTPRRQRAKKKLLRVSFADGTTICHKSVTMTFVEALSKIGSENFDKIQTLNCHLPLLSREIYPRYKEWMKPVCDGWYVNAQGDTQQKFMQLTSIKMQLEIPIEIEIGEDFVTSDVKIIQSKQKQTKNKLLVKFPNGEYVAGENPIDTFLETIWKIDIDKIYRKELSYSGKPLITVGHMYKGQIQIDNKRWIVVPSQTKEKFKILNFINLAMKLGLEITLI